MELLRTAVNEKGEKKVHESIWIHVNDSLKKTKQKGMDNDVVVANYLANI